MPPDAPSGSRLQHLRAPPLILPLLRHWPKVLFTLWYMLKRIRSNIGTAPSRIFGALLQYFHQYWQRNRPLWSLHGINSGRTGKILLLQEIKEIVTYLQKSSFHWFRQLNLLGVSRQSIQKSFSADTESKVRPWSQESWGFQKCIYICVVLRTVDIGYKVKVYLHGLWSLRVSTKLINTSFCGRWEGENSCPNITNPMKIHVWILTVFREHLRCQRKTFFFY